jgi:hypothetical protein
MSEFKIGRETKLVAVGGIDSLSRKPRLRRLIDFHMENEDSIVHMDMYVDEAEKLGRWLIDEAARLRNSKWPEDFDDFKMKDGVEPDETAGPLSTDEVNNLFKEDDPSSAAGRTSM